MILAYQESKIKTRLHNSSGYALFLYQYFTGFYCKLIFFFFLSFFFHFYSLQHLYSIFCDWLSICYFPNIITPQNSLRLLDLATLGRGTVGSYIRRCVFSTCYVVADAHVLRGMVRDIFVTCPELPQVRFLAVILISLQLRHSLSINYCEYYFTYSIVLPFWCSCIWDLDLHFKKLNLWR